MLPSIPARAMPATRVQRTAPSTHQKQCTAIDPSLDALQARALLFAAVSGTVLDQQLN
jgi:hypothetical protein